MAAALMFSANARADVRATLNEGDEAKVQINGGAWQYASTLKEAFDAVEAGQTANIELLKDINLSTPITMPATISPALLTQAGQNITLDLGGHTVTADQNITSFRLVKGTLDIEGTGLIKKETIGSSPWKGISPITVWGAQSPSAANWSVLTIGQDVTVYCVGSDKKSGYGVSIQDHNGASGVPTDDPLYCEEGGTGDYTVADNKLIAKYGYYTYTQELSANIKVVTESGTEYHYTKMHCGAPNSGDWNAKQHQEGCAFGVKILIHGTVTAGKRGIYVVGHVNQKPSCTEDDGISRRDKTRYPNPPYYKYQYPYILVAATAHVGASEKDGCTGIYGGGYAVFDIAGEVYGATGLYMKGGDVDLQDAYVRSTSSKFTPSGGGASGVNSAGGSAVAIESNDAYAGGSGLSITGDTKVEGKGGYAIFEETYKEDESATTTNIEIQGGTITGGHEGAIAITTDTKQTATEVTGGQITNGKVTVGNDSVGVSTLMPNTQSYHTTEVDNGDGTKTVVISEGAAPEAPATPNSWAEVAGQSNETTRPNIAWTGNGDEKGVGTIHTGSTVYLGELQIASGTASNGQTLTIEDGGELNIKQLILNGYARIIVEPGGRLVITGTQGMTAPSVNNILLKTSDEQPGYFMFHPSVTSNRHPQAKIMFSSRGYQKPRTSGDPEGGKYYWQRFGVPSWKAVPLSCMARTQPTQYQRIVNDNPSKYNMWEMLTSNDDQLVPFASYAMTTQYDHSGLVYTFTCEIPGNGDAELKLYEKYNYFSNSYTAPVDIKKLLQDFMTGAGNGGANVQATIYLNDPFTNRWDPINNGAYIIDFNNELPTTIEPMQAFVVIANSTAVDAKIDYASDVWAPMMGSGSGAPQRSNSVDLNTARIEIVAADGTQDNVSLLEGIEFSSAFDNSYDAAKFMQQEEKAYIYAEGNDDNMGILATDNLLGTTFGLTTKEQTSFTMNFSHVNGVDYAIRDMLTGTETQIVEGATYMFSVPANATVEGRFMIVASNKVPTAIENVEVENNDKGIYNMAGQYVGTDYHILPAGVYVVDGKKIVK